MALEDGGAGSREHVVDASHTICGRRRQLVARAIETSVEHFVCVASELLNALTIGDVPQSGRAIDRARQAVISSEVK